MPPTSLDELLAPLTWDALLRDHWGRTHVRVAGSADKIRGLASWRDLDAALETHRVASTRILVGYHERAQVVDATIDRRGHPVPSLNAPELHRHLREGRSLVLFQIDEMLPPVARLADGLVRHFGVAIEVNLFATCGDGESFGTHRDDHDHLIVQIDGRKRWHLFGARAGDAAPTTVVDEVILEPGDVLYVPEGHWHEVTDLGEPSLHLTCVVATPSGIDLLRWLGDQLCADPAFRMDLPRFAGPDQRRAHLRRLRELIAVAWTDDLLERYHDAAAASVPERPRVRLPDAARGDGLPDGDGFVIASNVPAVRAVRVDAGDVVFSALGREWRLDAALEPLVRRALRDGPWRFADLVAATAADPGDARALVSELVAAGLLFIAP